MEKCKNIKVNELHDLRVTGRQKRSKDLAAVGSVYGTWEVIEELRVPHNKKLYRVCRCVDCGTVRTFVKTKLIRETSACRNCGSMSLLETKKDLIESRYDRLLNKKKISDIVPKQTYWWKCEKGHSYQSNIVHLTETCPICEELENSKDILTARQQAYDKLYKYVNHIFDMFLRNEKFSIEKIEEIQTIRILNRKYNIILFPKVHKTFSAMYHKDKFKFYELQKINQELLMVYPDKVAKEIEIMLNFRYDSVRINELVVALIEELGLYKEQGEIDKLKSIISEKIEIDL